MSDPRVHGAQWMTQGPCRSRWGPQGVLSGVGGAQVTSEGSHGSGPLMRSGGHREPKKEFWGPLGGTNKTRRDGKGAGGPRKAARGWLGTEGEVLAAGAQDGREDSASAVGAWSCWGPPGSLCTEHPSIGCPRRARWVCTDPYGQYWSPRPAWLSGLRSGPSMQVLPQGACSSQDLILLGPASPWGLASPRGLLLPRTCSLHTHARRSAGTCTRAGQLKPCPAPLAGAPHPTRGRWGFWAPRARGSPLRRPDRPCRWHRAALCIATLWVPPTPQRVYPRPHIRGAAWRPSGEWGGD